MIYRIALLLLVMAACGPNDHHDETIALNTETTTLQIRNQPLPEEIRPYVATTANVILLKDALVFKDQKFSQQDILIQKGKIVKIGESIEISKNTKVIEAAGKTIIPGFIGMHNHTHMPGKPLMRDKAAHLYLAHGVTTMTTAGSADPIGELEMAKAIQAKKLAGPTIFPTAPYITGPNGNGPMAKPATKQDAIDFVESWAARGVTGIKLYRHTDPNIAKTVIETAHKHGLSVTGHLCSITFAEAAKMGIDRIEHGLNSASDFVADKTESACVSTRSSKVNLKATDEEVQELIRILIEHDVTLTSTLAIIESGFPSRPQGRKAVVDLMGSEERLRYAARQRRLKEITKTTSSTPEYWALLNAFEKAFFEAGGHLVAGPDTGRHVYPGYGDIRNFELLHEAGFTLPQVIQIMTENGAIELGIAEQTGRIAEGHEADLIIINGNLTENHHYINQIDYVVSDGIVYDSQKLIDAVRP